VISQGQREVVKLMLAVMGSLALTGVVALLVFGMIRLFGSTDVPVPMAAPALVELTATPVPFVVGPELPISPPASSPTIVPPEPLPTPAP
jgi:hypothetical protein